jgi:low affinity Fe/Cu permease
MKAVVRGARHPKRTKHLRPPQGSPLARLEGVHPHARLSPFTRFARAVARATGKPSAFGTASAVIVVWALTGPLFHYSDTWQLVINTSTTIVTFLMVFLIQNTQNRDSEALHLKLDEVIRAISEANDSLMDLEELEDHELDELHMRYVTLAESARAKLEHRGRKKEHAP